MDREPPKKKARTKKQLATVAAQKQPQALLKRPAAASTRPGSAKPSTAPPGSSSSSARSEVPALRQGRGRSTEVQVPDAAPAKKSPKKKVAAGSTGRAVTPIAAALRSVATPHGSPATVARRPLGGWHGTVPRIASAQAAPAVPTPDTVLSAPGSDTRLVPQGQADASHAGQTAPATEPSAMRVAPSGLAHTAAVVEARPVPAGQALVSPSGYAEAITSVPGVAACAPQAPVISAQALEAAPAPAPAKASETAAPAPALGHAPTRADLGVEVRLAPSGRAAAASSGQLQPVLSMSCALPGPSAKSAPSAVAEERVISKSEGLAFLRLSSECSPSISVDRLVYLDKDEVTVGRLPSNTVVLDSTRLPQMISRVHGRLCRLREEGTHPHERWMLNDNKSMNGILVNGEAIGQVSHQLQQGDLITFGRKAIPPEFEFIFEEPISQAPPAQPLAPLEAAFADYTQRVAELQKQLELEREQRMESQQRVATRSALDVKDLQSELLCSICRDWVVHASTLQCAHTFCWSCVEQWLLHKKFECPECRAEITREPVRSHVVEAIVQKTVERGGSDEKVEYQGRVRAAEKDLERVEQLHRDLENKVIEATENGKTFLHIDASWPKKEREAFRTGAQEFTGNTRETYCRLRGLSRQWVYSADDSKLNQALHNLGLQAFVSHEEDDIRKRLLMFLRYG